MYVCKDSICYTRQILYIIDRLINFISWRTQCKSGSNKKKNNEHFQQSLMDYLFYSCPYTSVLRR